MRDMRDRAWAWTVGAIIAGLFIGCGGSIRETQFEKGLRRHKENRLPAAARSYRRAIQEDPEDWRAHYNLGTVYHEIGNLRKARAAYLRALSIYDDPRARINLAAILEAEGKNEAALEELNKAVEADDDSAYPICYRGFFHERRGDLERAMEDYRSGIENEPDDAYCHFRLGALLAKMGQPDEALESLGEAVDLDPGLAIAWKAFGTLSIERGSINSAIRAFERLSTLEPDEVGHPVMLGDLYLQKGQAQRAADALWRARVISTEDERIARLLLVAYSELLSGEVETVAESGSAGEALQELRKRLQAISDRMAAATPPGSDRGEEAAPPR